MMKLKLFQNKEKNRFEFDLRGHVAKIDYIRKEDKIYLTHTEVSEDLGGKGIGSALVKSVLEEIEKQNLILVPLCPFVAAYIKRNPEWQKLIKKES